MTSIEHYSYLWDGSEPGWVLQWMNRQEVTLALAFEGDGPSVDEMKAVRRAVPAYREMTASQAIAELRGKRSIPLGVKAAIVAEALRRGVPVRHIET